MNRHLESVPSRETEVGNGTGKMLEALSTYVEKHRLSDVQIGQAIDIYLDGMPDADTELPEESVFGLSRMLLDFRKEGMPDNLPGELMKFPLRRKKESPEETLNDFLGFVESHRMSVRDVEAAVSEYFDSGVDVGPGMPGGAADNVSLLVSRLKKAGQSISADFPGRLLAEYAKRESEMRPLKECLEELGLDEGSRKVLLGVARDGRVGSLVIRSRPSGAPAMLPLPLPPVFPLVPIQKRVEALDELMRKISENWRGKEGFSVDFLPREDGSR